jgi:hypothetical protein
MSWKIIFVGGHSSYYVIWCSHNDLIFEEKQYATFLQGTYWLMFWMLVQRDNTRSSSAW